MKNPSKPKHALIFSQWNDFIIAQVGIINLRRRGETYSHPRISLFMQLNHPLQQRGEITEVCQIYNHQSTNSNKYMSVNV